MKYNLTINLEKLNTISKETNIIEAYILDWIISICKSDRIKIVNERKDGYTWISYSRILEDLPLLPWKTTSNIGRYISKLEKQGFITTKTYKDKNGHTRKYVKCNVICEDLFSDNFISSSSRDIENKEKGLEENKAKREVITSDPSAEIVDKAVDKEIGKQANEIYKLYCAKNKGLTWTGGLFFASRSMIINQIKGYGYSEVERITKWILDKQGEEYIPIINNPADLTKKWTSVQNAIQRSGGSSVKDLPDEEFRAGNKTLDETLCLYEKCLLYDNLEDIDEYVNGIRDVQYGMERERGFMENVYDFKTRYLERLATILPKETIELHNKLISEIKQNRITTESALRAIK